MSDGTQMGKNGTARPKIRFRKPWDREAQKVKELRARRARRTPHVYFFKCNEFVKIGWTTDANTRLVGCQVMCPYPIEQIGLMFGGQEEERTLHMAFIGLRHRAEWFRIESPLSDLLTAIKDKPPYRARQAAGDWFLDRFGKMDLVLPGRLEEKLETE